MPRRIGDAGALTGARLDPSFPRVPVMGAGPHGGSMRTARILFLSLIALALAGQASAASTSQGAAILAIQLSRGVADLASAAGTTGEITSFSHSELGVQAQYWYFLREDYAVNVSAGIGYFKQTDSPD